MTVQYRSSIETELLPMDDGTAFLLDEVGGRYYELNTTAQTIWTAIAKPASLQSVLRELGVNDSANISNNEVTQFLEDLVDRKLAKHVSPE